MKRLFGIISMLAVAVLLTTMACKKAVKQPVGLGTEATMSSPILQLGQSWQGNMAGLIDVTIDYDTSTHIISGTITNVSSQKLCWALSEPHMKLGNQTVGELGPEQLGDLLPGQQVTTSLSVLNDPKYTGYNYDGYLIHMEVYDCTAGIPAPYPGGI